MSLILVRVVVISLGVFGALGAWLNFYILRKLWVVIIKQDVRIAAIGKLVETSVAAPDPEALEQQKALETLKRIGSGDMDAKAEALRLLHYMRYMN